MLANNANLEGINPSQRDNSRLNEESKTYGNEDHSESDYGEESFDE